MVVEFDERRVRRDFPILRRRIRTADGTSRPLVGQGRILVDALAELLDSEPVKLLAVTAASNVTGLMPDVHRLARLAHDRGARILVDAAQAYAHAPLDVRPAEHPQHLDFVAA